MKYALDHEKDAIQSGEVFKGLSVDNPVKLIELFMQDDFKCIVFKADGENVGYIVFQEWDGAFIFHLYNFTAIKTKRMTEETIFNLTIPYCQAKGLDRIIAKAERLGMAKKLEKMGFKNIGGNEYRGDIINVF